MSRRVGKHRHRHSALDLELATVNLSSTALGNKGNKGSRRGPGAGPEFGKPQII